MYTGNFLPNIRLVELNVMPASIAATSVTPALIAEAR